MYEDRLRRAIALCKKGEYLGARKILENIVQADPKMDIAWIWLANTYSDNQDRHAVLKTWHKKNPKSLNARNWLAAYKTKPKKDEESPERILEIQGSQTQDNQGDEAIPVLVRRSDLVRSRRKENRGKPRFYIPALAVGLLLLLGLGFLGAAILNRVRPHSSPILVGNISSSPSAFSSIPSSIPSIASIPSNTPTPTFTPSNTPSQTLTPLPSSTATPTSTPSPAFTATPLGSTATINIAKTYLFAGPSVSHKTIQCQGSNCIYTRGMKVILLEKHALYGDTWFLVKTPDGNTGWLHGSWLLIEGDQNAVPTAAAYPTYPASAKP